jgi:hypothetical protein
MFHIQILHLNEMWAECTCKFCAVFWVACTKFAQINARRENSPVRPVSSPDVLHQNYKKKKSPYSLNTYRISQYLTVKSNFTQFILTLYPANVENMVSSQYTQCQQMADGIQFGV